MVLIVKNNIFCGGFYMMYFVVVFYCQNMMYFVAAFNRQNIMYFVTILTIKIWYNKINVNFVAVFNRQ